MKKYQVKFLNQNLISTKTITANNIYDITNLINGQILEIKTIQKNKILSLTSITADDKIRFFKELRTLLKVDMPIIEALNSIYHSTYKQSFKNIIDDIILSLKNGKTLYESLYIKRKIFGNLVISLVLIGEQSGRLDNFLEHIVKLLQQNKENGLKIKKALIYPTITILAVIVAAIFVSIVLIPKFERLYTQNNKSLPNITQLLIDLNHIITDNILVIIAGILFFIYAIVYTYKYFNIGYFIDKWVFKIFFIKDIIFYYQLSQFFLSLHILMSVNINIKKSMLSSIKLVKNRFIKTKLKEVYHMISRGKDLATAFKKSDIFPYNTISLLNIAIKAGSLNDMLLFISDDYHLTFNNKTDRFMIILEPMIISFVSLVVLLLALAMLLPMWNLSYGIGNL